VERETYEERNKRITVAIPRPLYDHIRKRLRVSGYSTMSDLIRELLRKWTEESVIEVKPHA